jgi:hypothetical protein
VVIGLHLRTHDQQDLRQRIVFLPFSMGDNIVFVPEVLEALFERNVAVKLVAEVVKLLLIALKFLF